MEAGEQTRSGRKHQAILRAAAEAFLSKGYLGASMDEIAEIAQVSKQTVYKHFAGKEQLFAESVLATTDQVDRIVNLVATSLAQTRDLESDLQVLAGRFAASLVSPHVLRLRRLVIASADRFPEVGRTWYEQGFERVLATLATCFQRHADQGLLVLDDPMVAANHFVGMLLWIPVNEAMFTGNDRYGEHADLDRHAENAVRAFLNAYGGARLKRRAKPALGERSRHVRARRL